jgi:hypothetical protein
MDLAQKLNVKVEKSILINKMGRIRFDLYNIILMHQYDSNPTRDIMTVNFLHNSRTRYDLNTKLEYYNSGV